MRKVFKLLGRGWRHPVTRAVMMVLGVAGILVGVWLGFPLIGWAPLLSVWLRAAVSAVLLLAIGLFYLLRWRIHRRRARALEDSLVGEAAGDGKVLSERMQEALGKLRKAGGKTSLYDLPWYIIIGPPGAGKTTALRNAGIEFPDAETDHSAGFGGTRNCDWWFSEEAVLIDTAGRYTTQDSDAEADRASWTAFLDLLKKGRPDQPINGVMLAFSVEDMMQSTPEEIARHAATVRDRLGEIHEVLRIDFPVYVLFTKADLISGFREYFASFSQVRRNGVWGVTFQTRDRKENTSGAVGAEFDTLVRRLSDEVTDRITEEPDGVARIAIFGLPGQMAMLRENVSDFLRRVFEPSRHSTNAILRGFYFTSGTQEGTPVDQVLGAMSREGGSAAAYQPAFMSGKGRSFFLHDLLKRVIFAERDWVGYDGRAVRRAAILRTLALALIGLVTLGTMGAMAASFWQNAAMVKVAHEEAEDYEDMARNELARVVIDDTDPSAVMPLLQDLRNMTAGYGDQTPPPAWSGMGLSRRKEIALAASRAYSDGLERMLRPRLILHMENEIPQLIQAGDTGGIYRALKVYLLLGGQGEGGNDAENDEAVKAYFHEVWRGQFSGAGLLDERDQLDEHLAAMLDLDGSRTLDIGIDAEIVAKAREAIVTLPLAEQAYASIKDRMLTSGIPDFNLVNRIGPAAERVFQVTDGTPLDQVGVPGLFTFEGYWGFFLEELTLARDRLREDQWVLGPAAERVDYETQLATLERELHRVYRLDFVDAWNAMFDKLSLAPMSIDPPQYEALASAGSPVASPLLMLVEAVDEETRLTRLYDQIGQLTPADLATGGLKDGLVDALFYRLYGRSGVFQRVVLDSVKEGGKSQARVGQASAEDTQRRQVERISDDFLDWQALLRGEVGRRPIDVILSNLRDLRENRRQAAMAPTPLDEQMLSQFLSTLTMNNTALPATLASMLNEVDTEYRSVAANATIEQLQRSLNDDVSQFCREFIAPFFPFGGGRHLSPSVFGQFFGPGGKMDQYYTSFLAPHVIRGPGGLQPAPGSAIGQRLSPALLAQFDAAQAIQLAFFASGSPEPQVNMSVSHVASSPTVNRAVIAVNGTTVQTRPNSIPAAVSWPGQAGGVVVELKPEIPGRDNAMGFNDGRWDIVNFLRKGRTRVSGNVAESTFDIGGRSITYRFDFDSTTVPFLMPELSRFSCPVALE